MFFCLIRCNQYICCWPWFLQDSHNVFVKISEALFSTFTSLLLASRIFVFGLLLSCRIKWWRRMFDEGNANCHGNSTVIFEGMVEKRLFFLFCLFFPLGT